MKIQALFEQGTEAFPEDQIVVQLPFVGVADGVSGLYTPSTGPRMFSNERTGGQMVSNTILQTVVSSRPEASLTDVILEANRLVGNFQIFGRGIPPERSDLLAGAAFALARIGQEEIEIVQAGDCFAVWEKCDGGIGATKNQVYLHDTELFQRFAELMEQYGDRDRTWRELSPLISQRRIERVNKRVEAGYGLLNGQPKLKKLWQKIVLSQSEVRLLLLFTDGLIYYPESGDEQVLGQKTIHLFRQGGLDAILAETRSREEMEKEKSHVDHAEASAVAVTFV